MGVRLSVQLGWLTGACFALVGACSLNPQPLPPLAPMLNDTADASAGSTTQYSGSDGGTASDTGTTPKSDSAPTTDVDAKNSHDGEAVPDAAPVDAGVDGDSAVDGGSG